ncbi:MAG TPA: hypothetical protein VIY56_11160 [Vicinamibacterales bacterium]
MTATGRRRRVESDFVLHGVLVGIVAMLLFLVVIVTLSGSVAQPPLHRVAHGLKVLGGVAGGLVAERRRSGSAQAARG